MNVSLASLANDASRNALDYSNLMGVRVGMVHSLMEDSLPGVA